MEKYRKNFRLFVAIQLCSVRLYGRFLNQIHDLSPHIVDYLGQQLDLPPSLAIDVPERKATYTDHRQTIMQYLGFQKLDENAQEQLETWIEQQARLGSLPDELFQQTERHLLDRHVLLPGPSVLERLIIHVCSDVHLQLFETVFRCLSPELRQAIDRLLTVPDSEQRSYFFHLKEYPPAASISSIQSYLRRYQTVAGTGIDDFEIQVLTPAFLDYFSKQAKRYNATDIKRFADHKRYAMMICFLLETRKALLDHRVTMHDQYVMEMCRETRNAHEKKHRDVRKRQKRAIDVVLDTTHLILDWPDDQLLSKQDIWQWVEASKLRRSLKDLHEFKRLEERGYGDLLLNRYPSLRKYFADFIHLPFAAKQGNEHLTQAIDRVRKLDAGDLKKLPPTTPTDFVPKELRCALKDQSGNLNRNAWEMGLTLAIKEALRSGDLYLPQSKQHVSFWDLTLSETRWQEVRTSAFTDLQQPQKHEVKAVLTQQFHEATDLAKKRFEFDDFAEIQDGKLKLKRYDKIALPSSVTSLQKVIDSRLPSIRIEQLLMEVDQLTGFSHHFTSIQGHQSRPQHFYKTLMATLISQATNLGVVSMSVRVKDTTVGVVTAKLS